jgi:hypothetical protein
MPSTICNTGGFAPRTHSAIISSTIENKYRFQEALLNKINKMRDSYWQIHLLAKLAQLGRARAQSHAKPIPFYGTERNYLRVSRNSKISKVHDKINRGINSENACHYSLLKLPLFRLLHKTMKKRKYKTIILSRYAWF